MAKVIHLKLTGRAEKFFKEMLDIGLNEQDVFAKALSVLEDVYRTKRIARIKQSYLGQDIDAVEFFYGINISQDEGQKSTPSSDTTAVLWNPNEGKLST